MDNVIALPLVTRLGPDAVPSSARDIAARIRSGRIEAEELRALYAQSGFRDWFARCGFQIHKRALLTQPSRETPTGDDA